MKRIVLILAIVLIVGYGAFEARRLISGPQVTILSPRDGTSTSTTLVEISGLAENISFLTINDNPAFTDESGRFSEMVAPPPGYTVFTVAATDRFGRKASAQVKITVLNYCPVRG